MSLSKVHPPLSFTDPCPFPLSFYGVNEFVAHVHGCDFGYFIGWMNAIGARSQQDMRVVWVRLADRWQCARGLLDFVRWCSTCTNTELEFKMDVQMWNGTHSWMMDMTELEELEKNDMRFMGATADALAGAIDLARQLRMTHTMTECTVRRAFFKWLGEIEFDCSGQRCSEFEDDFDGLCSVANSIARGPSECCKVDEDEVIVNV